ncbi:MAG: ATP-binding protein [Nodosilinea sp.]
MSSVKQTLQRILFVDDNPADRRLITHELVRRFPEVDLQEAADLKSFEQAFNSENGGQFDLIITDYELNWATGIDILQQVKQHDPMLPVVMFTDSGSQEIAVEAMKAGLDDYVLKSPKHLVRLSQAVQTSWENSQLRRRASELELRQQFLLNQLDVGVFRATLDQQLIEANQGFLSILGLSSLAAAQRFFREHFGFVAIGHSKAEWAEGNEWEKSLQRLDGQIIWVQVNATLIEANGKTMVDGLVSDITSKKEAALALQEFNSELEIRVQERTAQLEDSNRRLNDTNEELKLLASSLSHDLQAPLRQINGFVAILQEDLAAIEIPSTAQDAISRITQLTGQASRMIVDLLDYSRVGRTRLDFTTVNMEQIIQRVQHQARQEYPDRTVELHVAPLPKVTGDLSLLRRVWQNLISNAVKYTRQRDTAVITIRSQDEGAMVVFSVQDNGIGFDTQYTDRMFGPFQRFHSKDEFEGSGVGLASVKRIVHRHGGKVWAKGAVDQGATFFFSLPKTQK